ncbi:bifunctional metallophosphatase/5'-nucleotidase [Arsenicicoccus dermatophilus]|uniref:bifunctional metallophosphatase/5'-nucleotidase n=1 Tax=Arsenicicoccus dermatophilus TaxID=1076331 RepID=UPI003891CB4C
MSRFRSMRTAAVIAGLVTVTAAAPAVADPSCPTPTPAPGRPGHPAPGRPGHPHPGKTPPGKGKLVDLQVLGFNDFHGNLEAPAGSSGRVVVDHRIDPTAGKAVDVTVDAGGAAYLATTLKTLRQGQARTVTAAMGDQVGASPLLSAAFHDEPTIEAMNLMRVGVGTIGNHEFDEGYQEMLRLIKGGCLPDGDGKDNQNSCPDGSYDGAAYPMVAANVFYRGTNRTVLPAYTIKMVGGVPVGFVGAVLKATPDIVSQAGVAGLEFRDEVTTMNAAAKELQRRGVKAVVAMVHQGGSLEQQQWTAPDGKTYPVNPAYDVTCAKGGKLDPRSDILPIARGLSPQFDLVMTGHTHQSYVCDVPDPAGQPRYVTSALSFGRLVTDARMTFDTKAGDVVRSSVTVNNVVVSRTQTPDPAVSALIAKHKEYVKAIAGTVLGRITTDVTKTQNAAGESALGDLIADAQLADPSVIRGGVKPVVAFMNPGGIRTDLTYTASGAEGDGVVTYEEAFQVQPFNNYLVSMDLTGAQIYTLLGQQFTGANASFVKVLQVSKGLRYEHTAAGAISNVTLDGKPVANDSGTTYRIVTNNFLSDGGDGFPVFKEGTDKLIGGLDIDAFAAYLSSHSPYTPAPLDRIVLR